MRLKFYLAARKTERFFYFNYFILIKIEENILLKRNIGFLKLEPFLSLDWLSINITIFFFNFKIHEHVNPAYNFLFYTSSNQLKLRWKK